MKKFQLLVATPTSVEFAGEAESLTVPGASGEMTILPEHSALISELKSGGIRITSDGKKTTLSLGRGVVEVRANGVTVLLD